jgi:hypothetical protein
MSDGYRILVPLGVQRPVREGIHSHLSSISVKNAWSYISIPPYIFMTRSLIKSRDFIFTFKQPPRALPLFHICVCVRAFSVRGGIHYGRGGETNNL